MLSLELPVEILGLLSDHDDLNLQRVGGAVWMD
jgi:hypothetical protein